MLGVQPAASKVRSGTAAVWPCLLSGSQQSEREIIRLVCWWVLKVKIGDAPVYFTPSWKRRQLCVQFAILWGRAGGALRRRRHCPATSTTFRKLRGGGQQGITSITLRDTRNHGKPTPKVAKASAFRPELPEEQQGRGPSRRRGNGCKRLAGRQATTSAHQRSKEQAGA